MALSAAELYWPDLYYLMLSSERGVGDDEDEKLVIADILQAMDRLTVSCSPTNPFTPLGFFWKSRVFLTKFCVRSLQWRITGGGMIGSIAVALMSILLLSTSGSLLRGPQYGGSGIPPLLRGVQGIFGQLTVSNLQWTCDQLSSGSIWVCSYPLAESRRLIPCNRWQWVDLWLDGAPYVDRTSVMTVEEEKDHVVLLVIIISNHIIRFFIHGLYKKTFNI